MPAVQPRALLAVVAATVAGSIALAGAKYAEAANERDAEQEAIDEEARQLALSPEEEQAELAEHYEAKGLPALLAAEVAAELSRDHVLAAHVEAEHGIDVRNPRIQPLLVSLGAGLAFAAGAALDRPHRAVRPVRLPFALRSSPPRPSRCSSRR